MTKNLVKLVVNVFMIHISRRSLYCRSPRNFIGFLLSASRLVFTDNRSQTQVVDKEINREREERNCYETSRLAIFKLLKAFLVESLA